MSKSLWMGVFVVAAGAAIAGGYAMGRGGQPDLPQPAPLTPVAAGEGGPAMTVYKSPTCGCCTQWVDHVTAAGFSVTAVNVPSTGELMQRKVSHGITAELSSCHTAVVEGYVIEGHVPADLIHKLLAERPALRGLAVPGMPIGSPGMEGPNPERYDVLALDSAGQTSVYARR